MERFNTRYLGKFLVPHFNSKRSCFAWFRVLSIFTASISGLGTLAVPIVGLLASYLILNEILRWHEIVAATLIVSALFFTLRQN